MVLSDGNEGPEYGREGVNSVGKQNVRTMKNCLGRKTRKITTPPPRCGRTSTHKKEKKRKKERPRQAYVLQENIYDLGAFT